MTQGMDQDSAPGTDDIIFECPHCGKSMAIDHRGSGMVVVCPDCRAHVQVPGPFNPEAALIHPGIGSSPVAGSTPPQLEAIGQEIGLIQAALDRIVDILQQGSAEDR